MADVSGILAAGRDVQTPMAAAKEASELNNSVLSGKLTREHITNANIQGRQQLQNLNIQGADRGASQLYALMTLPDSELDGGKAIKALLDKELASGNMQRQTYDGLMHHLPPPTQPDGSPTPGVMYRPFMTNGLIGKLGGQQALEAVHGPLQTRDNGQQINTGRAGGMGAGVPDMGTTQTYPSRASIIQPQPVVGPNGEPGISSTGGLAEAGGNGSLLGPAVNGDGATPQQPLGANPPPPAPGARRGSVVPAIPPWAIPRPGVPTTPPGTTVAPTAPAAATTGPQAQNGPAGFKVVPNGPSPSDAADFKASTDLYNNHRNQANTYQTRMQALDTLEKFLPTIATGTSTEQIQKVRQFLQANAERFGIDNEKLREITSSTGQVDKYFHQLVRQSINPNSDLDLQTMIGSSPNINLSTAANQALVTKLAANERMQQAINSRSGNSDPNQYANTYRKSTQDLDWRGFANVDRAGMAKLIQGATPEQLAKIAAAHKLAKETGVLQ